MTVWGASQQPFAARQLIAKALGYASADGVQYLQTLPGGAFGGIRRGGVRRVDSQETDGSLVTSEGFGKFGIDEKDPGHALLVYKAKIREITTSFNRVSMAIFSA